MEKSCWPTRWRGENLTGNVFYWSTGTPRLQSRLFWESLRQRRARSPFRHTLGHRTDSSECHRDRWDRRKGKPEQKAHEKRFNTPKSIRRGYNPNQITQSQHVAAVKGQFYFCDEMKWRKCETFRRSFLKKLPKHHFLLTM